MREDGRSRWELERCGWDDKAIDRGDCLTDHITESGRIYVASANATFTLLQSSIYTIIAANAIFTPLHFASMVV